MAASAFLFSGDLYIDRLTDAGVSTGYLDVSNATQLAIGESTEVKILKSKMRDTRGQVIATVSDKNNATLKLTLNEINADKLAMALLGDVSALSQIAGRVSATSGADTTDNQPTITLIPDRWVQLPHRNLTATGTGTEIIIATTATTPVSVPLEEVEINHREGLIKYVGDASPVLSAATECKISYSYGNVSGYTISGSTTPSIKAKLKLDGLNMIDGTSCIVTIDEATLTPSSEVDFLSDDFVTLEMTGEMRTLSGKTHPYTVEIISA
jgi:hypothetical protein